MTSFHPVYNPYTHKTRPRSNWLKEKSRVETNGWTTTTDSATFLAYGPITIAIRARFEYDSTTIRLQHATTRYEVFRALAYEIVYENQW